MAKPKFQDAYNIFETPEFDNSKDPKVTIDSMAEDADINVIMKRFGLTGIMPEDVRVPNWGADYSEAPTDYRTALHRINDANEAFMRIPAEIRTRFQNDPGAWMEWVHNPANLEEARKLGLAKPPQAENTTPPATGVQTPPPGGTQGKGTSST